MTHPCPPGFRFRDDDGRIRGGAPLCPNPGEFAERMLRVFKQYPNPWVGIWTYEVMTGAFTVGGSYYLDPELWDTLEDAERKIQYDAMGEPEAFYLSLLRRDEHYGWDSSLQRMRTLAPLVPWVAKEVNRALKGHAEWPHERLRAMSLALPDIADWAAAERPDIMSMRFGDANAATQRWHETLRERAETRSRIAGGGTTIYRWSDGWHADLLTTHAELVAEGCAMGHCVGDSDYWGDVQRGVSRIVSLRDARGASKLTLELALGTPTYFWTLVQAKGFGNRLPRPDECARVDHMGQAFEWQNEIAYGAGDYEQCTARAVMAAEAALRRAGVSDEPTPEGEAEFFVQEEP